MGFDGRFALALSALVLVAMLLAPVFYGSTQQPPPPVTPRPVGLTKVVWVSVDSANYYRVYNLSMSGVLENFRVLFEGGAHGPMVVVYPSATAVNHATLSTGALPGSTGIVANSIHMPGSPVTSTVSGFNGRYLLAEPIWVTSDRFGLRTVVVSFPQSTPPAWEGRVKVDLTKLFNIYDAFVPAFTLSTLYTNNKGIPGATYVEIAPASGWSNLEDLGYVYKAWETSFKLGDTTWYALLADLNNDDYPDRLVLTKEVKDVRRSLARLAEGEWSKPLNTTIVSGGVEYIVAPMFKAVKLDPNDFRLYRGITRPFNTQWFNDRDLAWRVWNNVVVKVGAFTDGDWFALQNNWIDVETYMETVRFTNNFFKEFTLYIIENTEWDLIMTYTPVIDNVYHQFLGVIYPNMPYYDPAKAEYYWSLIVETYREVDRFIGEILKRVDLTRTTVIVTSDHGQCPVKYLVNVNAILYNAGLVSISGGRVQLNATKAWYTGHGHIFVNLKGREAEGTVDPSEYATVVDAIMRALWNVRDPDTGEPVFDIVMTREQAVTLGLYGERVGDVVIATKCGYTAVGGTPVVRGGKAVEFTPAQPLRTLVADHGTILPQYKDLHATFIAYGANIAKGYIGLINSINIAPTIAKLLGVEKPRDSIAPHLPIVREVEIQTVTATLTVTTPTTLTKTEMRTETKTETLTRTETKTTPTTTTITMRVTETKTETIATTIQLTQTKTETKTTTETTTTRVIERELNTTLAATIAVVALIIGLIAGFIFRRR